MKYHKIIESMFYDASIQYRKYCWSSGKEYQKPVKKLTKIGKTTTQLFSESGLLFVWDHKNHNIGGES